MYKMLNKLLKMFWLLQTIKEAVDARRFHHQLFPMNLNYEDGITTVILVINIIFSFIHSFFTRTPTIPNLSFPSSIILSCTHRSCTSAFKMKFKCNFCILLNMISIKLLKPQLYPVSQHGQDGQLVIFSVDD